MSFRSVSLFAVVVCGPLCAAPVPVQPKPDAALPASASKLLAHRKLQKELKMTAEQRIALVDALEDLEEVFEKKFQELAKFPNPPEEAFDKLDRQQEAARAKAFADAAKDLTAAQRVRLKQLDVRVRGATAFADPAIEKALQLTDAQKKVVKNSTEQLKAAVDKFLDGDGDEDDTEEQRKEKLFAFRAERQKDIEAVLTKEQKEGWARLQGDKPSAALNLNELWLLAEEEADVLVPKP
jgi:hypothetical protein